MLNQNNINEPKYTYKGASFGLNDWITRKIDYTKRDHITNVYHFYKKFKLEELGFINAELVTQNSDLILKIKKHIPTHPNEWTLSMIKDATLFHLNLFEKLYSLNLALKSSSLQNIFFDNTKPKFSDLTTLTMRDEETLLPLSVNDANLKNVVNEILLIIELIKQNKFLEIRELLQESNVFILHKKIDATLTKNKTLKASCEEALARHTKQIQDKKSFIAQCEYLHDIVININVTTCKISDFCYDINNWNIKQKYINQIITNEQPQTVLDVNAGAGLFSFFAEKNGANVIATDIDEFLIDSLYLEAKKRNSNILSLFMPVSALSEKVSCDLVLFVGDKAREGNKSRKANNQDLDFEETIKKLHEVTKKTLILNFDQMVMPTHNLDTATKCGLKYFSTVETLDLQTPTNKLLIFKK